MVATMGPKSRRAATSFSSVDKGSDSSMKCFYLEAWGDNQFEVEWALKDIANQAKDWKGKIERLQGFIPRLILQKRGITLVITGYGGYRFWSNLPKPMDEILKQGKVDVILYDRGADKMFFALEDTSATATGNQSQQRAERVAGMARGGVPVAYLLPAFAKKASDGGTRKPNLWVPIMTLNLISTYGVPALTFYYGTREAPDDKRAGDGAEALGQMMWASVLKHIDIANDASSLLKVQIGRMLDEIDQLHDALFYDFPNWDSRRIAEWTDAYSQLATGQTVDTTKLPFDWRKPIADLDIPRKVRECWITLPLAQRVDQDIAKSLAYYPVKGKGRGQPSSVTKSARFIDIQMKIHETGGGHVRDLADYSKLSKEGETSGGFISPTVLDSVLVLYERFADLRASIEGAHPHLKDTLTTDLDDCPAILFVAANVVRNFLRDPYAGMLASYSIALGRIDPRQKTVMVLWCPWQSPMVALKHLGKGHFSIQQNKGTESWLRHTDLTIFNGGTTVEFIRDDDKTWWIRT